MSLPRHAARAMLAALFVEGGIKQLRHPERLADVAEPVTTPVTDADPALPDDSAELVKLDGAVKLAGGVLLVVGPLHRPAALALAGSMVPTTLAGHRFWQETDPRVRAEQEVHFLKNVGLIGGLVLATLDTGGRPSVPWTARKAARSTAAVAGNAASSTRDSMAEAVAALAAGAGALTTVARKASPGRRHRRRRRSGHGWPVAALPAGLRSRRRRSPRPVELARDAVGWGRDRARHAPDAVAHAAGKVQDAAGKVQDVAVTAKDKVAATLSH